MPEQTTPDTGSLEYQGAVIANLVSAVPEKTVEDRPVRDSKPEQQPDKVAEQAPAAPVESNESEQATADDAGEAPAPAPESRTLKVKLPEGEQELPEDEVVKGYLRNADYTRKTQELATQRREFEERHVAEARETRQKTLEALSRFEEVIESAMPKEPDWQQLRLSVPSDVFAATWAEWDARNKQLAEVSAAKAQVKAEQDADAKKGFNQYVQSEKAKLAEAIPALSDPEKAPAIQKELTEYAASRGFTAEELAGVTDHRMVVLLHDAMEAAKAKQEAKAKAPEIKNKITNALAPSQPGANTTAPKPDKLAAAQERLKRSGRVEDAGAVFANLI